ncbi:DJ-1/PfpI family protein [Roseiflexus sp. RS-1]|jgi:Transcriptional regulator containing an amidase domain and an AraC-type DNA-binding HTH domain|uniref:DJ-1/PfpI family protein n=1 Tax=Roseiflexus sp. (strain RS-1) TaxID=357808 RepID=UPI0000D806AB|nr:DJ-1/PfpI family protein [Roseiflexus sp. RS-1]ABQ89890.1 ThiJ/PfpI domain protein [Roseiflexus sp. RS-1]
MTPRKRTVAILIFDDVELLDFAGPFEVFSSVRNLTGDHERLMDVFAVAESLTPVRCRNGLVVQPERTIDECPPVDVLVIPGGAGVRPALERSNLVEWVRTRAQEVELTVSVCTGSFLLAQAGLLSGRPATTHWERINEMRERFPDVEIVEDERWVDTGEIITAAGVSAGIDVALHVVRRLYGADVARATALGIEYDYWE